MLLPYLLVIASGLELVGAVLIALVVLGVHTRILEERRIDDVVLKTVKRERLLVYLGILLLFIGFLIKCVGWFSGYFV
jgi:hypothetical protein